MEYIVLSGQETVVSFMGLVTRRKVKEKDRKVTLVLFPDPTLSQGEMVW